MTEYVIGVDGGGTKTDGVIAEKGGKVIDQVATGPTSLTATSLGLASMNLAETFRQLLQNKPADTIISKAVIGAAGIDTPADQKRADEIFREALAMYKISSLEIVNDISLVLAAGSTAENAVALIAGTGSQCFGKTADGRTARTSGMDFLLADQGSGYEIGRLVLRAATASFDGRGPKSALEELLLSHFEVTQFEALKAKVYEPILNKTQIAELAKLWLFAYEQKDTAAVDILEQVIEDLTIMVGAVVDQLDLATMATDLICAGSIAKLDPVQTGLKAHLATKYAKLNIQPLIVEPVMGAIQLAQVGG